MQWLYDGLVYALYSLPVAVAAYLIGSIPFAYIIVKRVTGTDVTDKGSGNVGAMNVRRSTGSWGWFTVAMLSDGFKGLIPVFVVKTVFLMMPEWTFKPAGSFLGTDNWFVAAWPLAAMIGAVLGHNYSCWMALMKKRFTRTGKGLATGGGAMFAYDWRYFLVVLVVALAVIALTRYMMAGQVAAAVTLPLAALALRSPDWPFMLALALVVYAAHHKRFIGLLRGNEPKLYVNDGMGPRG